MIKKIEQEIEVIPVYISRIMQLVEGGITERWKRELFPTSQCANKAKIVDAKSITIKDIAGNFLLLAFGVGFSAICLACERILFKYLVKCVLPEYITRCYLFRKEALGSQKKSTSLNIETVELQMKTLSGEKNNTDDFEQEQKWEDLKSRQLKDENQNGIIAHKVKTGYTYKQYHKDNSNSKLRRNLKIKKSDRNVSRTNVQGNPLELL